MWPGDMPGKERSVSVFEVDPFVVNLASGAKTGRKSPRVYRRMLNVGRSVLITTDLQKSACRAPGSQLYPVRCHGIILSDPDRLARGRYAH
jgi:hypothetical protein